MTQLDDESTVAVVPIAEVQSLMHAALNRLNTIIVVGHDHDEQFSPVHHYGPMELEASESEDYCHQLREYLVGISQDQTIAVKAISLVATKGSLRSQAAQQMIRDRDLMLAAMPQNALHAPRHRI